MDEKISLKNITQKIIQILKNANGSYVDISFISKELRIQKRRVYDVMNVLCAAGLTIKNNSKIRWNDDAKVKEQNLNEIQENEVDQMLSMVDHQLSDLIQSDFFHQFGWITNDDLESLTSTPGIVFLAPKNASYMTLSSIETNDNSISKTQIHLKAESKILVQKES